jgi:rhamnulokinase
MSGATSSHAAVDLGASSGRVLRGVFDGRRLVVDEVDRFANGPIVAGRRMCWNALGLWQDILNGVTSAGAAAPLESIGVDTWGVDFALVDKVGDLIGQCVHYRDKRTAGILDQAFLRMPRHEIFAATGVQFMEINTAYQLLAMRLEGSPALDAADRFLMMPDLFHWLLTGEYSNEYTNATTTQLLDARARRWSSAVLEAFELPAAIFGSLTQPGTDLGHLRRELREADGLQQTRVIVPATHDTGSAVLAVPADSFAPARPDWCYISSGTWSLMGVELSQPLINDACALLNFTNEGGAQGSTRLLKNIGGLWLFQQCRAALQRRGRQLSWDAMVRKAQQAKPFQLLLNPDAPSFLSPEDMLTAIEQYAVQTGQGMPDSAGAVLRATLEGLALRYRQCLGWLESLIGCSISTIHIVGGGVQNELLCQMTADACQRQVIAGPIEATALGNVLMQLIGLGKLDSVAQAREIIRRSVEPKHYAPSAAGPWDEAAERARPLFT